MYIFLASSPLSPSCWNDLAKILPLHCMSPDESLRAPVQRGIVIYEAEFHEFGNRSESCHAWEYTIDCN